METIQAYTVPPWHSRASLVCKADREAAITAAKDADYIVIATSASGREELIGLGIGGIVAYRLSGQTDKIVARHSVTLGSRDGQSLSTAELEAIAIALALRCMPDGLQYRELTVLSSSQSALKAIARPRQQSGQVAIRQIYEHVERLRKGNNRVKLIWVPSRDDDLVICREAKRQAQRATRAECTQRRLPDRVGGHSKRIDRALPGKHTKVLYDSLKRREADVLAQLRTGMARINSYLNKIGAVESDMCECGRAPETMEHFLFRCA
ncbi:reverse transcriptase [Fusarium oxysporum f. sp. phaseoli]